MATKDERCSQFVAVCKKLSWHGIVVPTKPYVKRLPCAFGVFCAACCFPKTSCVSESMNGAIGDWVHVACAECLIQVASVGLDGCKTATHFFASCSTGADPRWLKIKVGAQSHCPFHGYSLPLKWLEHPSRQLWGLWKPRTCGSACRYVKRKGGCREGQLGSIL